MGSDQIRVTKVTDEGFKLVPDDENFKYQKALTERLDQISSEFDQQIINQIILWKVNRYALIEDGTIQKINSIDPKSEILNEELTKQILIDLLNTKGIQLAVASTILRFKNPKIYQIIDQRVYRMIYKGSELNVSRKSIEFQMRLYLDYLVDLRREAGKLGIPFDKSDRILYNADKRLNKGIPLNNYGSKKK